MKVLDGYDVETDEGMAYHCPHEGLLRSAAALVPPEQWERCPVCDGPSPMFYGDPDGVYWCFLCQIHRDYPLNRTREDC